MNESIDGIIVLDKPPHLTSARAVGIVKRLLPRRTKIGHAGTLDPFATGILVLLLGKSTRQCERIMSWKKQYVATIKLGFTTETDDLESPEIPYMVPESLSGNSIDRNSSSESSIKPPREQIEVAAARFVGAIEQVPPAYSALKIAGRRACDLVRQGKTVELKPRLVNIYSFSVLAYTWPLVRVCIDCGRGTYIRAMARDLGAALRTGGYLTELRRTAIGDLDSTSAVPLAQLTAENVLQHVHPFDEQHSQRPDPLHRPDA